MVFTEKTFNLPREWINNKRVLIIGLGGGCDVVSTLAIRDSIKSSYSPKELFCGTTTGPRDFQTCIEVFPNVYKLPQEVKELDPSVSTYKTILIESSMPRDEYGSPFLFVVPHRDNGSVKEITNRNKEAVLPGIKQLNQWDLIIGVDAGGDSLTGGIDFQMDPALGRDRQMLTILATSGIPFIHYLIGPGCDGESSVNLMKNCILQADSMGMYLGHFHIDDITANTMKNLSTALSPKRTTNILADAVLNYPKVNADDDTMILVDRGLKPDIPLFWLQSVLVFKWPSDMDTSLLLPSNSFFKKLIPSKVTLYSQYTYNRITRYTRSHSTFPIVLMFTISTVGFFWYSKNQKK